MQDQTNVPGSPKLSRPEWYRYYAGFSESFATGVLSSFHLNRDALVLDPWNGSGTTTVCAQALGYPSIGVDANPAMLVIARGRLVDAAIGASLDPLAADVVAHARRSRIGVRDDDPLLAWFAPGAVREVRAIDRSIQRLLLPGEHQKDLWIREDFDSLSPLAAFHFVALFQALRAHAGAAFGTNPTWTRAKVDTPIAFAREELFGSYVSAARGLSTHLMRGQAGSVSVDIRGGHSERLPLRETSVAAVVTSPPYGTRIDYAVATRIELATIGMAALDVARTRSSLMGSTVTTTASIREREAELGVTSRAFLSRVSSHRSKAASGYYTRYFVTYLSALERSIRELRRVVKTGGRIAIVVQGSYFKEIQLDLEVIVTEGMEASGIRVDGVVRRDARNRAQVNPGARRYRTEFNAVESVILATA